MIPPETDLVEVARQMLLTHIMKNPQFGALQVRIKGLCRIIVSFSTSIFFLAMVHPIVSRKHLAGLSIAVKLVGHQMRTLIDKAFYMGQKIDQLVALYRYGPNRAVAFNRNQHSLLLGSPASFVLDTVLVARFSADIFFIQFNDALKRRNELRAGIHHLSDGMTNLPGTLLRNANPFAQKDRGDSLARMGDVVHGQQPLPKGQLGAVHRGFGGNGELPFALGTFVQSISHAFAR